MIGDSNSVSMVGSVIVWILIILGDVGFALSLSILIKNLILKKKNKPPKKVIVEDSKGVEVIDID